VRVLTLWIPGLSGPERGAALAFEGLELGELARLYARGTRREHPRREAESALAGLFGLSGDDVPVAPLALLGETGERRAGYWLRADPVHISAGIDRTVMGGTSTLAISAAEAQALCAEIAREMAEEGLLPQALAPSRWYMNWPDSPRVRFTPLPMVIGADLYPHMPEGEEALAWRRLINHAQMVLHASPVNAARRAAGQPEINGLWFWGGGELPTAGSASPVSRTMVWSDDPYVRGLALNSGAQAAALPEGAAAWLHAAADGDHLLYMDVLREPLRLGAIERWRELVTETHERWIAPLAAALRSGALAGLRICPGGGTAYDVSRRGMRWRWWRRVRPVHRYRPD
jgi:hypothetical protein